MQAFQYVRKACWLIDNKDQEEEDKALEPASLLNTIQVCIPQSNNVL